MTIKKLPLFGKFAEIRIFDIDESLSVGIFDEVYAEGIRLQKIFNFYDPESELSRLNKKREMKVTNELLFVIKTALAFSALTEGKYDISKGRLYRQRKAGVKEDKIASSYKDIKINGNKINLTNPDAEIDLGSIAKGYIVDQMVEYMENLGIESGFIDARGDMRIFGNHSEIVEVQHPRDKNKTLSPFIFKDMAAATSGDYSQYHGSYDKSHIVGKSDLISVTVIAETLMKADALATCFILLGMEKSKKLLEKFPCRALMIDSNMTQCRKGFEEILAHGQ